MVVCLEFLCKVTTLFCNNKIKMELYFLFCKILLESWILVGGGADFCMARKILRPRLGGCFVGGGGDNLDLAC